MEKARQRASWVLFAGSAVLSVALSRALLLVRADSLPQTPCEDVLALVLGDARQQLSMILFDKVEEYFHGGVRCLACEEGLDGQALRRSGDAREAEGRLHRPADPWAWLNGQVHVQSHKHLENDTAVELLPWIWASCRASPKNIQAFVAGSYVLSRMVGRPEDAVSLLQEGARKNPDCAELDFALGEMLLNRLSDPARAEPYFLSALQKNVPGEGEGGEEARVLKVRTLFYLGYLAKQKGEGDRLRAYVREADAVDSQNVCAKNLHTLLKVFEDKE